MFLIAVIAGVIVVTAWWSFHRFSSKHEQELWIEKVVPLAAKLEKRSTGYFLEHKKIQLISLTTFKSFDEDTLFVKFGTDNSLDTYLDGVLILNKDAVNYTDTGAALSLMYGVVNHIFDQQQFDFHAGEKSTVNKVRSYQYIADVISISKYKPISVKSFNELSNYKMKREFASAFNNCGESLECRVIQYNEIAGKY